MLRLYPRPVSCFAEPAPGFVGWNKTSHFTVILSVVEGSRSEASAKSKDPIPAESTMNPARRFHDAPSVPETSQLLRRTSSRLRRLEQDIALHCHLERSRRFTK